jgi:hypothetical protein
MKKFHEFINEDFTPRKMEGRDEEFQKMVASKIEDQKKYLEILDIKRNNFLDDIFDALHGVKSIGKNFNGVDGMSFNSGKRYNLFTRYNGEELVVRLDLSKAVIELCAVYEKDEEPVIVPVRKLD